MLDFQEGVKVIKGCDFKISSSTTMAEAKEALEPYLLKANDRCISFMCNDGLNLEEENLVIVNFCKNGLIHSIEVNPGQSLKDVMERKEEIAALCRRWLEMKGQFSDRQCYEWGSVSYLDIANQWLFIGIQIYFNREFEENPAPSAVVSEAPQTAKSKSFLQKMKDFFSRSGQNK